MALAVCNARPSISAHLCTHRTPPLVNHDNQPTSGPPVPMRVAMHVPAPRTCCPFRPSALGLPASLASGPAIEALDALGALGGHAWPPAYHVIGSDATRLFVEIRPTPLCPSICCSPQGSHPHRVSYVRDVHTLTRYRLYWDGWLDRSVGWDTPYITSWSLDDRWAGWMDPSVSLDATPHTR